MATGGERPPLSVLLKNLGFLVKTIPIAHRKAEHYLGRSIALCREIGAKGFEAQALMTLGLVHKARKRSAEAGDCLAKAERIFAETEATGILKQTREALAALE